jgi:hypothetical protein
MVALSATGYLDTESFFYPGGRFAPWVERILLIQTGIVLG